MSAIAPGDLKPFQVTAVTELTSMIQSYGTPPFGMRYDSDTGNPLPFLCRLKAITGAGKTPILAAMTSQLKDGIFLWTTNRGSVVTQTYKNLSPDGKYALLLPEGTDVHLVSEMSDGDWETVLSATSGVTILLLTVASFNQKGDTLRIHQPIGGDAPSRWTMLGCQNQGPYSRRRNVYALYDEGHGATQVQFERLSELNARAFVLASASPIPPDLMYLLPGKTGADRQKAMDDRTVLIPTKQVVEAGLLKPRLYFTECNTSEESAIQEAQNKYVELVKKLKPTNLSPIACFIVNSTERGVDVWQELVDIGVPKSSIAVHLNGAKEEVYRRLGSYSGLNDTYTGKKPMDRSPESLNLGGYSHLIWNLTLREGWDEPLAYIGYIDDRGKSDIDITQKIGRFLRQPNSELFDDPDLNAAYFYFNVDDKKFKSILEDTQQELEDEGYEVFSSPNPNPWPPSREVPPMRRFTAPAISLYRGDPYENDNIVLSATPLLAEDDRKAPGLIRTFSIDVATPTSDPQLVREKPRESAGSLSAWEYISAQLRRIDSAIVGATGTIFSPKLKNEPKMTQSIQYGSKAMALLNNAVDIIRRKLDEKLEFVTLDDLSEFEVKAFRLISPDVTGVAAKLEQRYKVRRFKNSVHREYNGLNPFEVQVAEALDKTGKVWCRNPSTSDGYGIPIPVYGADSNQFKPDFLYQGEKSLWAIDPKGKHLFEGALSQKMWDLDSKGVRIAFILDGAYTNEGGRWVREGTNEFTLVCKYSTGVRSKTFSTLDEVVKQFK